MAAPTPRASPRAPLAQVRPGFGAGTAYRAHQRTRACHCRAIASRAERASPSRSQAGRVRRACTAADRDHVSRRIEHQRSQPAFAARAHRLLALSPTRSRALRRSAPRSAARRSRALDRRGEKDARLAVRAIQLGRHDEFRFGERLRLAEARAAAIREQVSAAVVRAHGRSGPGRPARSARPVHCMRIRGRRAAPRELALPVSELRAAWRKARESTVIAAGNAAAPRRRSRASADRRRARRARHAGCRARSRSPPDRTPVRGARARGL